MTRRSPLHRTLTSLVAVWFALSGLVTGAGVPCPMHAGVPPAEARDAGSVAHRHGDHGASASTHASQPDAPSTPAHDCNCASDCCGVAAIALTAPAPHVAAAEVIPTRDAAPGVRAVVRAARVLLLPYANGPPTHITA